MTAGAYFAGAYPAPGAPPRREGRGRPPADPWRELRARAEELHDGRNAGPPARPGSVWCEDDGSACDRGKGLQGASCSTCGGLFYRPMACMGSDCPRCADGVATRRGARCSDRMGRPELGTLVLTFPRTWRPYLTPAALLEAERAWKAILAKWAERHLGGRIGGRIYWHPCGDRCESCGHGKEGGKHNRGMGRLGKCSKCGARAQYKPHLNMLIPGIVARPDGTLKELHLHLGERQLAGLQAASLELLRGMADVMGQPAPERGNVWWGYRDTETKKAHSWRYFGRPFPAWRHSMPHLGRDFGLMAGQDKKGTDLRTRYRAACRNVSSVAPPCPCPRCGAELDTPFVLFGANAEFWRQRAEPWPMLEAELRSKTRN